MKEDTFIVEAGDQPTVFSLSPDSPVAPYLTEHRPESLEDMFRLGIIHSSIRIEHLEEALESAKGVSIPDAVYMDEKGRWVGDRKIPGLILTSRKSAIVQEAVSRASAHLERRGYTPGVAKLTAQKAASFLSPIEIDGPTWRVAELNDLEVHGVLFLDRRISAIKARNVFIGWAGWIVPDGNYFMLHCDKVEGEPPPTIGRTAYIKIWQSIAGIEPPGPIEGWTDRLAVNEIRQRATQVSLGWR